MPSIVDPELCATAKQLMFNAQKMAQGMLTGFYRAPRRGTSTTFLEHKVYAPGDDIRRINWAAAAKTGRYHMKLYEDEANLRLVLLLDASGSMGFATKNLPSKYQYASQLAAALSYMALNQGNAVGLWQATEQSHQQLSCSNQLKQWQHIVDDLVSMVPAGKTCLHACLQSVLHSQNKPCTLFLFSDLFETNSQWLEILRQIQAKGHCIYVVQTLNPVEITFDFEQSATFVCMESQQSLFVQPSQVKKAYTQKMNHFLTQTKAALLHMGVFYIQAFTNKQAIETLKNITAA